jgi:hypothetical protein
MMTLARDNDFQKWTVIPILIYPRHGGNFSRCVCKKAPSAKPIGRVPSTDDWPDFNPIDPAL